jgi:cysteinyl-tRNA synthetase
MSSTEQTLEQYMFENSSDDFNNTDTLTAIVELVNEVNSLEEEMATLQAQLERASKQHKQIIESQLPDLMESAELSTIQITSGETISVEKKIRAHIKEENQETAHTWLRDHEYGYLLKRVFRIQFSAGNDEEAELVKNILKEHDEKIEVEDKTSVHPSTLAAFVKEIMEEGVDIPTEPFGILNQKFAKIVKPKEKKPKAPKVPKK